MLGQALETSPLPIFEESTVFGPREESTTYVTKGNDAQCLQILNRKSIHCREYDNASRPRHPCLYFLSRQLMVIAVDEADGSDNDRMQENG